MAKAIFEHCKTVYKAMLSEATDIELDGNTFTIYKGYLTRLITDTLDLPVSYYSAITRELMRMDCIRNYKRGGGAAESEWLLLKDPTEHDYIHMPDTVQRYTKKELAQEQRMRNLEERVGRLEQVHGD